MVAKISIQARPKCRAKRRTDIMVRSYSRSGSQIRPGDAAELAGVWRRLGRGLTLASWVALPVSLRACFALAHYRGIR